MMRFLATGLMVLMFLSLSIRVSALEVISSYSRPDRNSGADRQVWEGFFWAEGWNADEQFYPMHFKPAGSLHVFLRNNTEKTQTLSL
ncbi:MAG TPA: hypothetical protein PKH07_06790, partial [bacterium]|nr:hypothetical protein [bacterium]